LSRVKFYLPEIRSKSALNYRQIDVYMWQVIWSRQPAQLDFYLPHVNEAPKESYRHYTD
jgi:hypothetical protein